MAIFLKICMTRGWAVANMQIPRPWSRLPDPQALETGPGVLDLSLPTDNSPQRGSAPRLAAHASLRFPHDPGLSWRLVSELPAICNPHHTDQDR